MTPRALPVLALVVLLPACEPAQYWNGLPPPQWLETTAQVTELSLPIGTGPGGTLAPREAAMLEGTVRRLQAYGSLSLDVVLPPEAAPGDRAALMRSITALGIPADRVRQSVDPGVLFGTGLVRLHTVQMRVPSCPGVPGASTTDMTPLHKRDYVLGCATAANFANMLVDPRDLTAPPARPDATDSLRAVGAIDKLHNPPSTSGGQSGSGLTFSLTK